MPRTHVIANGANIRTPKGTNLFTNERQLGSGQFGDAYAVRHRRTQKLYCLKVIRVRTADDAARQQAVTEVTLMRETCNHPNIVAYHDSWFNGNYLNILMEYCCNGSLDELIDRFRQEGKRFTEAKITHYMQELSGAFVYCHRDLRIVHRDLKPANILMDEIGTLKLADFGLAKCLDVNTDLCATFCGSPLYMSPEQCDGGSYSFPADMWSLGCILYELMALSSPWIDPVGATNTNHRTNNNNSYPAVVQRIKRAQPNYSHLAYPTRLIDLARWMLCPDSSSRASAVRIHEHLQMRSPPALVLYNDGCDAEGHVALPTPLPSPQPKEDTEALPTTPPFVAEDVQQLLNATLLCQRSFRAHREMHAAVMRSPRGRKGAPGPASAAPPPAPDRVLRPMDRHPEDRRVAMPPPSVRDKSANYIQKAFRASIGRGSRPLEGGDAHPLVLPAVPPITRLDQLAAPRPKHPSRLVPQAGRGGVPPSPSPLFSKRAAAKHILPSPRPAWV